MIVAGPLSEESRARALAHLTEYLAAIGVDLTDPVLAQTPRRVLESHLELLSGREIDERSVLGETFPEGYQEMVIVKDLSFASLCEHHLLPFYGHAHIAYIPNRAGQIVGLSKLGRLLEVLSTRLQVQERLTSQMADTLDSVLTPRAVMVVVEAEHLCMAIRGIKKPGSTTITSALRGSFRTNASSRAEAMQLIGNRKGA